MIRLLFLVAGLLATSPAEAHLLGGAMDTAFAGFLHPFSGLDHLLAMVAVGLWAGLQGRPAAIVLPLVFPAVMALGGAMGASGILLPSVETGIAASVLVFGILIGTALRPPLAVGLGLVSLFALFHGHAHGTELPDAGSPFGYGIGFVAATLLLHLIGLGLVRLARLQHGALTVRAAGSAVAIAGIVLLAG